jgi:sugar O-acyltransferase (sialic acid O-acetyltransferase NeuD family)
MSDLLYAIYGASGCGRSLMPIARHQLRTKREDFSKLVFVDDNPPSTQINGHNVLRYSDFLAHSAKVKRVAVAVSNSYTREKLVNKLLRDGILPWSLQAANAIVMDNVEIGDGALLSPFVTLTSNIRIGHFFHANLYSYVEHDCVIGDFVTFAPRVNCNGNIHIEDHVYVGTGAMLRQGNPDKPLIIGKGAIIGMGAVVTKDVPAGAVVAGNPAKPLAK